MKLYVIKDVLADEVGPVFNATNDAVAIRKFSALLEEVKYPTDYELWCVGEYDSRSGKINETVLYNVEKPKFELIEEDEK